MNYTRQEVEQFVVEEDVKFIHLTFCDVYGNLKNRTIMPGELAKAFDFGISADAWTIAGFDVSDTRSDLLLRPDPSTLAVLPRREDQDRAIRMFADIIWPDGRPFEADTRYILKKAVEEAESRGVFFSFSTESLPQSPLTEDPIWTFFPMTGVRISGQRSAAASRKWGSSPKAPIMRRGRDRTK